MLSNRSHRHAFTLTEIAIVLAIIGVILGAIWVAASTARENANVRQLTTDISALMDRLKVATLLNTNFLSFTDGGSIGCNQNYMSSCNYDGAPSSCTPAPVTGSWSDLDMTAIIIQSGIVPADMIKGGGLYTPWSPLSLEGQTSTNACSNNAYGSSTNAPTSVSHTFIFNFSSIPASACTKFVVQNAAQFAARGLIQLGTGPVTGSAYVYGAYGITPANYTTTMKASQVANLCSAGGTASVVQLSMQFTWPSPNY